jgi:4-amino-4-deoxy-L-arabinose transferase-like glycosyltransferase
MTDSDETIIGVGREPMARAPGSFPAEVGRPTSSVIALAPIAIIVVVGAALRISQLDQSLFGDELWTYVGATRSSLGQVIDWVRSDQEITPPLFTVLAWISAKAGDPTVLIRLPSLLAGIAVIPLIFALGLRTVGRRAAYIAATLAALSPYLAFSSIQARGYSLVLALVAASTLSLLIAIDRGRWGWWAAYAGLCCAAMYTHYTAVYVLLAQLAWALWCHPEARRRILVANLGAALAYLPWLPGVREDFQSPTQHTIGALAPFDLHNGIDFTARFALGHPGIGLHDLLGTWLEVLLALGMAVAVVGLGLTWLGRRKQATDLGEGSRTISLVVMLALAAPIGVAVTSLIGNDIYLPDNLVTSWAGLALALGALLAAGPPAFRAVATTLVVVVFAYGAIRTTDASLQRPDIKSAAEFIDKKTGPKDVVLDVAIFGVGGTNGIPLQPPALALDINFNESHDSIDYLSPSDGPRALRAAAGRRLALAGNPFFVAGVRNTLGLTDSVPLAQRTFQGALPITTEIFAIPPVPRR